MPLRPSTEVEALALLKAKRTRPAYRPAPTLGRSLQQWLKSLEARFGSGPQALQARWREIVGETIARRTEPVKLTRPRGGGPQVLELKVDGPSAAIVQHQVGEILDRVNLFLGAGAVGRIRIVQGPVKPPAVQATIPSRRRTQPPLDVAEEARLAAAVADVPDERLRAALLRIGRGAARATF